jgi:hypothetical protein
MCIALQGSGSALYNLWDPARGPHVRGAKCQLQNQHHDTKDYKKHVYTCQERSVRR